MNAIIGYADLASRHLDDPAKLKNYMENIQVCGQNLLMLLNNVLDLARIENDKTEMEYSVSDIEKDFRNCVAMFRNQADSKGADAYGDNIAAVSVCLCGYSAPDRDLYKPRQQRCQIHGRRRHDPLQCYTEARRKRRLVRYGGHGCR